ncbi:hypothetical protein AX15_004832 [Amanita polypyramis BW_CC]|nr:hypothetical protein AX15_004832 [Amanita polypyramis BW_CC]
MDDTVPVPPELSQLSLILQHNLHLIATGCHDIQATALLATQYLFNQSLRSEANSVPYINQLISSLNPSDAPETRSKSNRKRKRSPSPPPPRARFQTTPLTALFVDGMSEDQIWAQLDIQTKNICNVLNQVLGGERLESEEGGNEGESEEEEEEEEEEERSLQIALETFGDEDVNWSDEDETGRHDKGDDESEASGEEQTETITELRDPSSDEDNEPASPRLTLKRKKKPNSGRHPELDDGFFDLAVFNTEVEAAEAKSSTRGRLGESDEEATDEEDVDMFAPIDQGEVTGDTLGKESQELYYNDFFVPPKQQQALRMPAPPADTLGVRFHEKVRVKKIRAEGKGQPLSVLYDEADDFEDDFGEMDESDDESQQPDDMHGDEPIRTEDVSHTSGSDTGTGQENGQETIGRFKDDLFAEEEEASDDMTTHEKRMAALSKQISELEAENVAQKDWVLMGEAGSRSRPQNSLLEEDLEFERVIKPVPIVTQDTVLALEDRIRARILEGQFDDVVRLRPHDEKPFLPSRFFELKDTKSAQSLAQIYEDEYIAAQNGGVTGDDRDGKLRKEHEEIEKHWESICYKLDALCNAHYTPKEPKAVISTVSNVPVTALESALPTTKSAKSMLAPEEVFLPVTPNLRARSEMTPSEKRALHNKQRKAKKKTRDILQSSVDKFTKMKDPKKQKQAALESVVKSGKGVTVVGKKNKDLLANKSKKT